ncbi:MAG: 50S ribosomal protein L4 [Pseudomonadota bacterium]
MELTIKTLDGKDGEKITLNADIFGLEPREDILQRVVRWQLAKRRAGTHDVKNRAEIHRTGKKMYNQKGTGRARHSSARANLFRGGGRSFGPTPRDHGYSLPKKIRALGLKHALSAKAMNDELIIIDTFEMKHGKTKDALKMFGKFEIANALFIDGETVNENFGRAARNVPHMDVLPVQGINVYDILRREKLVLTRAAVTALEERFK